MPQIDYQNKLIIWDQSDALSCLDPQYLSAIATTSPLPQLGAGLVSAEFNPYRFAGYFSPDFAPSLITTSGILTSQPINACVGFELTTIVSGGPTTGFGYMITATDAQIAQISMATTAVVTNSGNWPYSINPDSSGTLINGCDIVAYSANGTVSGLYSPTPSIFYSYNVPIGYTKTVSGTSYTFYWNVGRYYLDSGTFQDNFMSEVALNAVGTPLGFPNIATANTKPTLTINPFFDHPLIVGNETGNRLYIGDGNQVHMYDGNVGNTGTFYPGVFVLPVGWRITCFARFQTFLCIFCFYYPTVNASGSLTKEVGEARCYMWDYSSNAATYLYELFDNYVSEAVEWNGTVACFTSARPTFGDGQFSTRTARLQVFDGTKFSSVMDFIGSPPIHGGAEASGLCIRWSSTVNGGPNGVVYQYGAPMHLPGGYMGAGLPSGLNVINFITSQTSGGMLRTLNNLQGPLISGSALNQFNAGYDTKAYVQLPMASPLFAADKQGKVTRLRVEFANQQSGSVGLQVSVNLASNFMSPAQPTAVITNLQLINATNQLFHIQYDTSGKPLPNFMDLSPIIQWSVGSDTTSAPIVKRIIAEYDEVETTE
jgi:hypothetical protein